MFRSLFGLAGVLGLILVGGKVDSHALQCDASQGHSLEAFCTFSCKAIMDSGEAAPRGSGVGALRALAEDDEHVAVIVPSG